ncbi:MAG: right-handed parallel beta-helix repeat-containing protein [Sedimentisphaerales bacterium]|nr:right-handed parallel beta-helix repeat-containing protein [Sedimentisphaerales bacterium]
MDGDSNTTETIPFDLLGIPRVLDGDDEDTTATVDMGAYEYYGKVKVSAGEDRSAEIQDGMNYVDVYIAGTIEHAGPETITLSPVWSSAYVPLGCPTPVLEVQTGTNDVIARFAKPGTYTLRLTAVSIGGGVVGTDTVNIDVFKYDDPPRNILPTVDAGPNQTEVDTTCTMQGDITDDGLPGGPLKIEWHVVGAPEGGMVKFYPPNSPTATATFSGVDVGGDNGVGIYILELAVSDNATDDDQLIWQTDTVSIDVSTVSEPLEGLRVYAGSDKTNESGDPPTYLSTINFSDAELIYPESSSGVTFQWTQIGGPASGCEISNATQLATASATFNTPGLYQFRLTATQGEESGSDEVYVNVLLPIVVDAGQCPDLRLPAVLKLEGGEEQTGPSIKDLEGEDINLSNLDIYWSMVSGPGVATFNPPLSGDSTRSADLNPTVRFSHAGTYTLRLTAAYTGNSLRVYDDVSIKAKPGKLISAGNLFTVVVLDDGTVVQCGLVPSNINCGWPQGDTKYILMPVLRGEQEGTHTNFKDIIAINAGRSHVLAIDHNTNAWSWGCNNRRELGNDSLGSETPTKVKYDDNGNEIQLNNVVLVSAFLNDWEGNQSETTGFSLAVEDINEGGHVWSWGSNYHGVLGNHISPEETDGVDDVFLPDKVLAGDQSSVNELLCNITTVSSAGGYWAGGGHTLALEKIDGSAQSYGRVYAWGSNGPHGYLGINSSTLAYSAEPLLVHSYDLNNQDGLQNITAISTAQDHNIALDTYGNVYTWGMGSSCTRRDGLTHPYGDISYEIDGGRLGVGDTDDRLLPAQVICEEGESPLQNIIAISAGRDHSMALEMKNEKGYVWTWGDNHFGQLGIGNKDGKLAAVQVKMLDSNGKEILFGDHCDGGIIAIDAGIDHSLAVDAEGVIWAWGHNNAGQLSTGSNLDSIYPTRMIWGDRVYNEGTTEKWFSTIQAAIDDEETEDGETIVVYPGEYYERIDFKGKDIVVTSIDPDDPEVIASTIINGGGGGTVVSFTRWLDEYQNPQHVTGKLVGITVMNGDIGMNVVSGTYNPEHPYPVIEKCRIANNDVGIVCNSNSKARIEGNWILNSSEYGIENNSSGTIQVLRNKIQHCGASGIFLAAGTTECLIQDNWIANNGSDSSFDDLDRAGITICPANTARMENNTIVDNTVFGIAFATGTSNYIQPEIRNCIIWGNGQNSSYDNLKAQYGTDTTDRDLRHVFYCCVGGGYPGRNNIPDDPKLVLGTWELAKDSPCINTGSPGLIAHWEMTQTEYSQQSDTVSDTAGPTAYDGDINGATWAHDGLDRYLLYFDASNDYVDLSEWNLSLDSSWLLTFWVNVASYDKRALFGDNSSANGYFWIDCNTYPSADTLGFVNNTGNSVTWTLQDTDEYFQTGSFPFKYVVLSGNGTDIDAFVANSNRYMSKAFNLERSSSIAISPTFNLKELGIGGASQAGDFKGGIDDVRLYATGFQTNDYVNQTDINGTPRLAGSRVDIGAYEYPSRIVTAGQDKELTLTDQCNSIILSDAAVTYKAFSVPDDMEYEWSMMTGPTGVDITDILQSGVHEELNPTAEFETPGEYILELAVKEDHDGDPGTDPINIGWDKVKIMVRPGVQVQIAAAEPQAIKDTHTIYLPDDYNIQLDGAICLWNSGSSSFVWGDDLPDTNHSIEWTFSDPSITLSNPASINPTATFPQAPGQYTLTLNLKDENTEEIVNSDSIVINVNPTSVTVAADTSAPAPLGENDPGRPARLLPGMDSVVVELYGTVAGGEVGRTQWVFLDGPATVTLDEPYALNTDVWLDTPGIYEFGLIAESGNEKNGYKVVASDTVQVAVESDYLSARITASEPEVDAEGVIYLASSGNALNLYGNVEGGSYDHVLWSGTGATFGGANALSTWVTFSTDGVYDITFEAQDDSDATLASDVVTVVVGNHGISKLEVDAGADQVVLLIDGSVTVPLYGVLTESGQIVTDFTGITVAWLTGDSVTISNPTSINGAEVELTSEGIYRFGLRAKHARGSGSSDDEYAFDTVTITVLAYDAVSVSASAPSPFEIGSDELLNLSAQVYEGFVPSNALVRWHVAGYRPAWATTPDPSAASGIATIHNPNSWDAQAELRLAGTYAFTFEVFIPVTDPEYDEEILLCSDTTVVVAKYPDVNVRGWVEVSGQNKGSSYKMALSGTPKVATVDLNGTVSPAVADLRWEIFSDSSAASISMNPSEPEDATATFTKPGAHLLAIIAAIEGVDVGINYVEVFVYDTVDFQGPRLSAGADKVAILSNGLAEVDLDDAEASPGSPSEITWSANLDGVTFDSPTILNPTAQFTQKGIHELTLAATVSEVEMEDHLIVEVYGEEQFMIVDAGVYENVALPRSLPLINTTVRCASTEPLSYQWEVVAPRGADVLFYPSARVEKPRVSFPETGNYILRLTVTAENTNHSESDEAFITVEGYGFDNTHPIVSFEQVDEISLDVWEIVVQAEDEQSSVRSIDLAVVENSEDKILTTIHQSTPYSGVATLTYLFRAHEHDLDPSSGITLKARAVNGDGVGFSDPAWVEYTSASFTKDSSIKNMQASPTLITSANDQVTVTATIDASEGYTLTIIKDSDKSESEYGGSSDGDGNLSKTTLETWTDGLYWAQLTRGTTPNEETVTIPINVAIGLTDKTLVAEISSLNDGNATIGNGSSGLPYVKSGSMNLMGSACYQGISSVEYKLELFDGEVNPWNREPSYWLSQNGGNPIKTFTPETNDRGWKQASIIGGTLGTLDLSDVPNGIYEVLLSVRVVLEDGTTIKSYDSARFILDCPLKIGNVTFSQEDVTIPVAGIPLTIVRTYNSLNRHRDSDFGYGWDFSIVNMDIKLNEKREERGTWSRRVGSGLDRDVTLTLPDGRRVTFAASYTGGNPYALTYKAPAGVEATLTTSVPMELMDLGWGRSQYWIVGTTEYPPLPNFTVDISYHDVPGWKLTTKDGTVYNIERHAYGTKQQLYSEEGSGDDTDVLYEYEAYGPPFLKSIVMPTGETVLMQIDDEANPAVTGIKYYDTEVYINQPDPPGFKKMLKIEREDGRVSKVYSPSELDENGNLVTGAVPCLKYKYDEDGNGNLIEVERLEDRSTSAYVKTTYIYDGRLTDASEDDRIHLSDHYIVSIKDERGLSPIRYVYDTQGKLVETIDARGESIKLTHGGDRETVTDRSGVKTDYYYNSRGNVTEVHRFDKNEFLRSVTLYDYDANAADKNIDKPIAIHQSVDLTADQYATTIMQYGTGKITLPNGSVLNTDIETTIDPVKNKMESYYDAQGRLVRSTQYKPDDPDNPNPVYTEMATTWNTYDSQGRLRVMEVTTTSTNHTRQQFTANIYMGSSSLLVHSIQVDVDQIDDFDDFYTLTSLADVPTDARDHVVVTSYLYSSASNSLDQPYKVTDPYCPGDLDEPTDPFSQDNEGLVLWRYFFYDNDGRQTESVYDFDAEDDDNYFERVRMLTMYDAMERTIETSRVIVPYDYVGGVWDPDEGNTQTTVLSETTYNSIGKVNTTTDESGILTKYWYDETGNLVETLVYVIDEVNPSNNVLLTTTQTLYDKEGRTLVTVGPYDPEDTNAKPVGIETVYDSLGRVVETRRWSDVKIDLEFFKINENGATVFESQTVDYAAISGDPVGKGIPSNIEPANATDQGSTEIGWKVYNGSYVIPETDGANLLSTSRTEYDGAGRVESSYAENESGTEVRTTKYVYDLAGRQIKVISLSDNTSGLRTETLTHYDGPRRDRVKDAEGNETSFEYDALGRVITTIHPRTTFEGSTGDKNLYTHTGYDGLGRKAWDAEPTSISKASQVADAVKKQYRYDAAGRLVMVILPGVGDLEDPEYPIYRYYYDIHGNQICILDPEGRATLFEYNELGQQTHRYMPFDASASLNDLTNESYMPTYTTIKGLFDLLEPQPDFEQTWYDKYGRIEQQKDYKGQYTVYSYYVNDNTDPDHFMDSSNFLGIPGQLRIEEYYTGLPDSTSDSSIAYTYDKLGRKLTEVKDGDTWQYSYDDEGHITSLTSPQGTVNYEYNLITGRKTATWTGTSSEITRTEYSYDDLGRLMETEATRRNNNDVTEDPTVYAYNANGSRASVELPNGVFTEYQYNALNRLTHVINWQTEGKTSSLSSFVYSHMANGMRATLVEELLLSNDTTRETHQIVYGYDALNRLTSESCDDNPSPATFGYGYTGSYFYDLVGNRTYRHIYTKRNDTPSEAHLWTEQTFYPGTDRIHEEIHTSTDPRAMLPWGNSDYMYAYADGNGSWKYGRAGSNDRIGHIGAYFLGLPSKWSRVVFIVVMALIPLALFWPLIQRWYRAGWAVSMQDHDPLDAPDLRLWHRMLCVLLAYIFLIGPDSFQIMAHAEIQYSQLHTSSWGAAGDTITYTYDDNGSIDSKTTAYTGGDTKEEVQYEYNYQGRLSKVTTIPYSGGEPTTPVTVTEYKYNPQGIRVEKIIDSVSTKYLVDPYNHTGYAQVLEEWVGTGSTPAMTYTIGDDIISQTDASDNTEFFLYDGQGSTRQLVDDSDPVTVNDSYSYDAYGVMLGGNPTASSPASTSLLYTGERFDEHAQQYYLRARYYNPMNGLFNRMDPYAGSMQDPQSLHKYLYCHANPVNGIDPSGKWGIFETVVVIAIVAILVTCIGLGIFRKSKEKSKQEIGLQTLRFTKLEMITLIDGYQKATKVLNDLANEDNSHITNERLWRKACDEKGVIVIGEALKGATYDNLTDGQRRIVGYFESPAYLFAHQEIMALYPKGEVDKTLYCTRQCGAEIIRLNSVIQECRNEAIRRGWEEDLPEWKIESPPLLD